ncbi:MAG: GMC family oxidoreductase N-terminal domain-containing protein [Acidimicrobiia bacterium]
MPFDYDVAVIGSGFGGSVAALRLTEKGYRVGVMEAGRRYTDDTLPKSSWDLGRFFWFPKLGLRGIQRLSLLRDVLILSGAGVGGGSLVWANVCYEPLDDAFDDPQWSHITDWKKELAPFYDQARRMLGVEQVPFETNADQVMRAVGRDLGVEHTFHLNDVAVHFGPPGEEVPDPYFGGEGPARAGCHHCGGCMVGCRYNAKNRLDKNYLYLAEKNGAVIHADHMVIDVEPLADGGYRIRTRNPAAWLTRPTRSYTANQVVFAAGALGTTRLLMQLRDEGRLPNLSPCLGYQVRTNSEAVVGASAPSTDIDYSHGVAITSSIHPDPDTTIEPVRYPAGSNSMGLLSTILVDGGGRVPRWMRFLAAAVRHPVTFIRSLSVRHWSERTVILLVMQSIDNSLRLLRKKSWFGTRITSAHDTGKPNPRFLPVANQSARAAGDHMGGFGGSSLNEVLLNIPITAHILGGACVADSAESGVIDPYHRVFGHPGLHVVDGAAVAANLGVNPSLTITAMAERAMAMWPNRGENDPRPAPGDEYRTLDPIRPVSAAVPKGAAAELRFV